MSCRTCAHLGCLFPCQGLPPAPDARDCVSLQEQYLSQRILVDAAFAAAVEEDGFVTAYPPVGK